ncbi:MAG: fasciclin domain-containing protein [Phycisphaerales bacterium]|nr:fasciclin domain-containing protein [Phycisphaerales bacterium]
MSTRFAAVTLATIAALAGTAFGQCDGSKTAASCEGEAQASGRGAAMAVAFHQGADNIVATAKGAGMFKTLLAAAAAADLAGPLSEGGPFTVFAPTDEAFALLPKGTVETLLKPENKAKLAALLKFHVVPGVLDSRQVTRLSGATSLNGQRIGFSSTDTGVSIDGATVVKADIGCSNGVIHVIDRVIMPAGDNIAGVAQSAGMFGTLLSAAQAAGLVPALTGQADLTVFAPTDEAFALLPKGTVETLLKPENKDKLASILKYHVVAGRVYAADAAKLSAAETLNGQSVVIDLADGALRIDGARVVKADIDASNGVIHVIDRVILPE